MRHWSLCPARRAGPRYAVIGVVPHARDLIQLLGLWAVVAAVFLGGCAVKLAPDYDKAIFDGLTKVNEDAMKLFASVSSAPFTKREDAYNSVIGELNAVQVQIKSRPTPTPPPLAVNILRARGDVAAQQQAGDALVPPTGAAVDTLIKIMTTARNDDQRGRLAGRIDFIKEAFAVQMAQALAYEKALQR